MTHNIIKTENYLLIVDDSEIKEGKTLLSREGIIHTNIGWNYGDKVIIAHLPLNGAPVLEGVPLLPPLEDEVGELAQKQWGNVHRSGVLGFIEGYNKAKEKYKYTEEDLMEAMLQISEYYADNINKDTDGYKKSLHIIKSLQQPKMPVAFECEDEYVHDDTVPYPKTLGTHPKTIVNPQGQTVLAGKYIY